MADNTALDPGTGGDTIRDKDRAGVKTQIVGLDLNIGGAESLMAGAMPVTDNGGNLSIDDGGNSITVDNGGTFATQESQIIADNAGFTDGTSKVFPVGLIFDEVAGTALTENDVGAARMDAKRAAVGVIEDATTRGQRAAVTAANALKVDASGVAVPVTDNAGSLTVDASAGTFGVNNAQVSGTAISVNSGVKDAGTQRVILASDQTVVPVSDNAGSLTVDNAGTFAVQIAANSSVNQAQIAGTTTDTNSGVKSAGTQRIVIATDQPQLTNALKTDGSAVTQPVSGTVAANVTPKTSGGLSVFHLVSAATTNATNVKASAGQLYGWYIYNSNAAARKVAFHNTAGTPTAGASVVFSVVIPAGAGANVEYTNGLAFATGIAITTVTGLADSDSAAVAANDLIINLFYA